MLPDCVRVIQGDGVNPLSIRSILGKMAVHGWAADNVAFGMGGALLQDVTRDDLSFAMKGSAKSIDNGMSWTGFSKDPITMNSKRSKSGRLAVIENIHSELITIQEGMLMSLDCNELKTVWEDGELKVDHKLADIRARAQV